MSRPGELLADRALAAGVRAIFALPRPVQRRLAGPVPEVAAGLEPDAWLLARIATRTRRPAGQEPLAEMRARFERGAAPLADRRRLPVATEDLVLGGLPLRLYVPAAAETPGPLLVYYHGGGWAQGSIRTHDPACRLLAHLSGVRVLSVEYRLAPEHPFPAAADDALTAYAQAVAHAGRLGTTPERIAVGGDSAGGNLAAVTAIGARDDASLPGAAFQLLIYPGVDMTRHSASRTALGEGFFLTEASMTWYEDQYVPEFAQRADPRVSPLLAPDLSRLPPAYVATALADPLRDEGEAYAARLREAGVPAAVHRHPHIHGFFNMTITRSGLEAVALTAGALRQGVAAAV